MDKSTESLQSDIVIKKHTIKMNVCGSLRLPRKVPK